MQTSGCPKNQNKCWNKTGSPPPVGSKKEVLMLRSNNNIVMPPAKTGKLKTRRKAVTQTLIKNRGMLNQLRDGFFKLFIVHKKLIEPAIELTPAI